MSPRAIARLQRLNAALHEEPIASIAYCIFWLVFLCCVVPATAALVLPVLCLYRICSWRLDWRGANEFDPSKHVDTELAILITGCDTGIGKELALWADKAGFVVFAGCLKKESFEQFDIKDGSNIKPVILDVTSDQDVARVAAEVSEWLGNNSKSAEGSKRIFHGLVNNAGIEISGFFDWLNVSDYQKVMDVNYFGTLRCCKAFLPIFKEQAKSRVHGGSRIINISSIAGLVPGGPVGSPYVASKHAIQVFTEALRQELAVFGINVTSINPSFVKTDMHEVVQTGSNIKRTWDAMAPELREEYGIDVFHTVVDFGKNFSSLYWEIEVVVDQIVQTLKVRETPGQLLVGLDARYLIAIFRMLPGWYLSLTREDKRLIPAAMKKSKTKSD